MPVNITIARSRVLLTDNDNDGQPDPGDVFQHTIIITNSGSTDATSVVDTETENGLTIDPASVKIGPIAFNDSLASITGNTPITFTTASLLANDQDPDGPEASLVFSGFSNVTGGTLVDNGNGTLTFTPTTGFTGNASFTYGITDAQGLSSVAATPGTVTIPVSGLVWYVDKDYAGANGPSDGSFLKPFTDVSSLNGAGGSGDVDGDGDTIFIYDRSGTDVTANIVLENNQKLFGDGHAFVVNGLTVGATTSNSTIDHSAIGITLASGNTIDGIDLTSSQNTAVGIADGNGTVGALSISNTNIGGSGQIIDIDQGGTLTVSLGTLSSNGSTGANGGVIDITGVSGTVTFTGPVTINGTQGQTGIDISGNNNLAVSFGGLTTVNTGAQNAIVLASNTGTSTMGFTGGLDVDTTTGTGFSANAAGTLTVTGSNAIDTTTGQILSIVSNGLGASGASFATLTSTGVVTGNAVNLNTVSGTGAFSAGTVTIAGATGDGINMASSSANATITTATVNNTTGEGIDLNGNTGSFTVTGGNIGNTNDPAGDTVNITGGTGAVSIGANLFKSTAGNIVDVSGHATGAITFSGNLSATAGLSSGIALTNNTSGNITFSGAGKVLNTGANTAISFTNTNATGATVAFQNGGLDIDTTSGTGINATNTTIAAGSLSITGTGNSVTATTGRPVILDGVSSAGITFESIASTGSSGTAIFLKNAGTGGFTVTGTNADDGSGGTINHASGGADGSTTQGQGVYLENVSNVSLSNMNFTGTFDNYGIRGLGVNNFTLRGSNFTGAFGNSDPAGAETPEGDILFGTAGTTTGLTGTALFEGNVFGGAFGDTVGIYAYGSGSLNLTFRDTPGVGGDPAIFNANSSTTGQDGLIVESGGTSNLTLTVTGVDFNGARGDQLQVSAINSTTQNISITGNSFDQSVVGALGGGVRIGGGGNGNLNVTYNFSNNTMTGSTATAIDTLFNGLNGTISGVIANNTIGTTGGGFQSALGQVGSLQGFGIRTGIDHTVGGTMTYAVRIEGNQIHDTSDAGIDLISNNAGNTGTARLEATITSNTIGEIRQTTSAGGIYATLGGGGSPNDTALMGLRLTNNNITAANNNALILDQLSAPSRFYIPGYSGSQNGEFANAFFPPATNGTASAGISAFLAASPQNNLLTNGVGPSHPGANVYADAVVGVTGASFVLPVPILAAVQAGEDWETALQARLSADTSPPGTPTEPPSADPGSGGGDAVDDPTPGDKSTPAPADDGILSQAELDTLVQAAIQRWADAGATPEQLAAMRGTAISVADMTGAYLATSSPGAITVDSDGAGHSWFIDPTPADDSEFEGSGSRLTADAGGPAEGRMDLLTVLMHELGHQVGLEDLYSDAQAAELMYGYENMGERRLPESDDLAAADPSAAPHGAFLLSPIAIGTLPANHAVQVSFTSTVNSFSNQVIPSFNNTSSVSFSGGGPVVSSNEALAVDSLSLGNLVFIDANNNGALDGGEVGVTGVAMSLFADANNDNVADGGAIATTTTAAGGLYSFTSLAPGNYIVSIDASNFTGGGALVGRASGIGSADPDNNVDNDDNGIAGPGGTVVSQSITLSYNNEPTPGTGNDTNVTVDFGFVTPNQAPVNTVPGPQATNEDISKVFSTGNGNAISVADADAGSGELTVEIGVNNGTLTLSGVAGLTFDAGDGTADLHMIFSGTLANINAALNGLTYTPTADYNGPDLLTIITNDNGNSGADPGLTGGPNDEQDSDSVAITVNSVNDAPSGVDDSATIIVNGGYTFSAADFNFSDPADGNSFAAVIVASTETNGALLFDADGPGGAAPTDVVAGQVITAADLAAGKFTFVADPGESGTPYATFTFRVRDNGGGANGGIDTDPTPNTFTFNVTNDAAPVLDLNGAGAGTDSTASFTENGPPVLLASGAVVSDADDTDLEGATLSITGGFAAGFDFLTINGSGADTVNGITFSYDDTTGVLTLTGTASLSDYQALLREAEFASTSDTPTASRTITWTVNDGIVNSSAALTSVTVTAVDDPAVAEDDAFVTDEASSVAANVFSDHGSGPDNDHDGPALSVAAVNGSGANVGSQIMLPSGALLTVNANGTFDWDPNGAFDATPDPTSGASNQPAIDSFTYTLTNGGTATVMFMINGIDTNDLLLGSGGADVLTAGVGNDRLDGLAGADTMNGGPGNDQYEVDNSGDVVNEAAGEGTDTVRASVSYTLLAGSEVEVLTVPNIADTAQIDLIGNGFGQQIIGNNGSNGLNGFGGTDTLIGNGGNDYYVVDSADDQVVEAVGGGFDIVFTPISYTLPAGQEIDSLGAYQQGLTTPLELRGNEFDNRIVGNAGDNSLAGGGGNDQMYGEGGNDIYLVDGAGDQVVEFAGEGFDIVLTTGTYTLSPSFEVESLGAYQIGSTNAFDLIGNGLNNRIVGNAGDNLINGLGGNDTIFTEAGTDFIAFSTALGPSNVDYIVDFDSPNDTILLDHNVFAALPLGALNASAFVIGTGPGDADDRIIYNSAIGSLLYDPDGSGAAAAIQFATVQPGTVVNASDFIVI